MSAPRISLLVEDRRGLFWYWCAWAAAAASQLLLVALVRHPPLLDYPNHLARAYVLRHIDDVPAFHAAWQAAWKPLPNLSMDLFMLVLQPLFGIDVAGRIFVGLTLLVGHVGCHVLGRGVQGRPTWAAIGAQFFVFNTCFLHGFLNYAFGVGVFLIALGYWLPRRRAPSVATLAWTSLLAIACYLSHLSSIGFLGLGVATFVIADLTTGAIDARAAVTAFLPFVVPVVLLARVPHGHGPLIWPPIIEKVRALGWLYRAYSRPADLALAVLLLAAAACLWRGRARGEAAWSDARPLLALAGGFAALYFVCPAEVAGTWAADRRFLCPAAILAILSLRFQVQRRAARVALALVMLAFAARAAFIGRAWLALDARIEARCTVLRGIAPGSSVYRISLASWSNLTDIAFPHVLAYASILDHAVVRLFAVPSQQPLLARDGDARALVPPKQERRQPAVGEIDWPNVFARHPYVWVNAADASYLAFLRDHCADVTVVDGDVLASACHAVAAVTR